MLRRLKPIPTFEGEPATKPHDIAGVTPSGEPFRVPVVTAAGDPAVLLFLKADCEGCHELWAALPEIRAALPAAVQLVVVTRGPDQEDPTAIADLGKAGAAAGVPTVMSAQALTDYRVFGPPFFVVADADRVRTEGVPWGVDETMRAVRAALDG
jgi:hypothetical protein